MPFWLYSTRQTLIFAAYVTGAILIWHVAVVSLAIPDYFLPLPEAVFASLLTLPEFYARHTLVTLGEAAAGATLGAALGFTVGVLLRYGGPLGRLLGPPVVASQVFPKEALAPIFLVMFGYGMLPKVIISALICFFPVAIATQAGLLSTPAAHGRLMRVLGASKWDTFWRCELPFAAASVLSALRVCATLSVIGAIVGEFVGASAGLGHVIRAAYSEIATDRIYASLVLLGGIGGIFYGMAACLDKIIFREFVEASRHLE